MAYLKRKTARLCRDRKNKNKGKDDPRSNKTGKTAAYLPLKCENMDDHCEDPKRSEYVCKVKWFKKVPRERAKWRSNAGLYTTQHVARASLENQKKTLNFLEKNFRISFKGMV